MTAKTFESASNRYNQLIVLQNLSERIDSGKANPIEDQAADIIIHLIEENNKLISDLNNSKQLFTALERVLVDVLERNNEVLHSM